MSAWETYWTAGYTVRGASDVIVNNYCRTEEEAGRKADAAAKVDAARLRAVGVESSIDLWVERWKTRRVEERGSRHIVGEVKIDRRCDPVDLATYPPEQVVVTGTADGGDPS